MNEFTLKQALAGLRFGGLRYFDSIGSTNDEALAWAADNAPDLALVVADEQNSGRGRLNRKWLTPPGSAIAASLILRPEDDLRPHLSRVVGLAALAIAETLGGLNLSAQIKWPNDILLGGKKVAGILIENVWTGERLDALVIGMGINVRKRAVPPAEFLTFPATSIEDELKTSPPARAEILSKLLGRLIELRPRVGSDEFLEAWESGLAFRGRQVQVLSGAESPMLGEALGLAADGSLRMKNARGEIVAVRFGDVSLRGAE